MKKLMLFAVIVLSFTACSPNMEQVPASQTEEASSVSSEPDESANAEVGAISNKPAETSNDDVSKEETPHKVEAQNEINIYINDLLAQTVEAISGKFGPAIEDEGGFRYEKLGDVTLFAEDGVVQSVAIRNGNVDVFGARVGQTPAEITNELGDPESSFMDEESGEFISQYKVNADTTAFFFSDNENMPTSSVLVSYLPFEFSEEEQQEPTYQPEEPSEKANVIAVYAGTDDDKVIIQVTNAGMTPVKNVFVQILVSGINPLGKDTSKGTYATTDMIDQGETKDLEVWIPKSNMDPITNVEIQQITAVPVRE
jgi:hypothetical protein